MAEANAPAPLALPNPTQEAIDAPFAGDLLRRRELAGTLTAYLERLRSGAVLALDAPWGEGKTWFARHWAAQLRQEGYRVGVIDAFEQDYIDDPFLLIAAELTQLCAADEGAAKTFRQKVASAATTVLPFLARVGVNALGRLAGTSDLADGISEAAEAASDDAADAAKAWVEKRLAGYAAEKASVQAFTKEVEAFTATASDANDGRPVVVFIDELDRCRPAFAVRLIERIKHFFDVPNLVFVLVMNRDQLEKAIRGVYGTETDATAYLGKFLHLSLRLPKEDSLRVGENNHIIKAFVDAALQRYGYLEDGGEFAHCLAACAVLFNLSLRDIERACALYLLSGARWQGLMAYLIALKIKRPEIFRRLRARDDREALIECIRELSPVGRRPEFDGDINLWPASYFNLLKELLALQPAALRGEPTVEDTLKQRRRLLYEHSQKLYGADTPHDVVQAFPKAVARLDLELT
ncbi:KAP family P-loop NTPase fold protein [Cupriavidus oxalaticus]|uniref:KAP NTPase domain-containing protein n=1 Tax=Cupriavidus oxalaticus TaxID=96344 RepID=A0A5P3VSA8_9BURK|nr:P-loop NTPase fold protein [Cupriavidus oxalaticus]QEZ48997.1 hypothetical protein D2917_32625 [Cupriavidus oxalaticus]